VNAGDGPAGTAGIPCWTDLQLLFRNECRKKYSYDTDRHESGLLLESAVVRSRSYNLASDPGELANSILLYPLQVMLSKRNGGRDEENSGESINLT